MGLAAYAMSRTSLYGRWFAPWLDGWSLDLRRFGLARQDLGAVLGLVGVGEHVALGLALGAAVLVLCWRALPLRKNRGLWLGAALIGVVVAAGYALTAGPIGKRAMDDAAFMSQPPDGLGVQSYSFAGPLSDAAYFLLHPSNQTTTFGVMAVAGALLGALLAALLRRDFRLQGLAQWREGARQLFGAVLTGGGAVLGLGCTVGHGLSGISVLSVGSMLGLASIFTGAWLAIRLEAGRRAVTPVGARLHGSNGRLNACDATASSALLSCWLQCAACHPLLPQRLPPSLWQRPVRRSRAGPTTAMPSLCA